MRFRLTTSQDALRLQYRYVLTSRVRCARRRRRNGMPNPTSPPSVKSCSRLSTIRVSWKAVDSVSHDKSIRPTKLQALRNHRRFQRIKYFLCDRHQCTRIEQYSLRSSVASCRAALFVTSPPCNSSFWKIYLRRLHAPSMAWRREKGRRSWGEGVKGSWPPENM